VYVFPFPLRRAGASGVGEGKVAVEGQQSKMMNSSMEGLLEEGKVVGGVAAHPHAPHIPHHQLTLTYQVGISPGAQQLLCTLWSCARIEGLDPLPLVGVPKLA
jgi:hypothetical protein